MLGRRAFLGRLLAAIPVVAAVRQLVPVPPPLAIDWGTEPAWALEPLDVRRVDVFDSYEYSWRYVESAPVVIGREYGTPLAFKMRRLIEDLPRNLHETLFTSDA